MHPKGFPESCSASAAPATTSYAASYTAEQVRAGYAHAAHLLELLARITPAGEGAGNFVDLVQRGAVTVANGTRIVGVSPPLSDPQAARDIFITEGLTAGALDVDAPFEHRNRSMLESVREVERRARREDLMVEGLTSHTVGGYGRDPVRG